MVGGDRIKSQDARVKIFYDPGLDSWFLILKRALPLIGAAALYAYTTQALAAQAGIRCHR